MKSKSLSPTTASVIPLSKQGCLICQHWKIARQAKYYKVFHCTAVSTNQVVAKRCLHFKWNGEPVG